MSSLTTVEAAAQAAARLAELTGVERHDVAIVLGSGWVPAADAIGTPTHDIAVTDLPGFAAPAVLGHAGRIRSIDADGRRVLVFLGRTHLYEGRGVDAVVGQPVLIADHLNLTATSPLHGATFIDLTDLYSTRLRTIARSVDPTLTDGVYAQLPGPHYETPAEIAMLRTMGADLVGMSTTLEAIAAREAGAEVLGISLVTNLAAGMTGEPLDHKEVLAAGNASAARMGALLAQVVSRL
jgi:purine-nucleoside phosphorylase